MTPDLILPLSAVISALTGYFAAWLSRRKLKAEEESVIVVSAEKLVRIAMKRIDEMSAELRSLRIQIVKAVSMEQNLRMELGKVRARVIVLEGYIVQQGLSVPNDS